MPPWRASHSSHSSHSAQSSRFPSLRRSRLKFILLCALGIGAVLFIFSRVLGSKEEISLGRPLVVVVTVMKGDGYSKEYLEDIRDNRIQYAKKHGYATFFPQDTDYELAGAPLSWSKVPAMRHAMALFPHSTYFWFLERDVLIMNPTLTIEDHVMNPQRMEELMIKDHPVVLPDSVIKTFTHLRGNQIDFALTQDKYGLAPSSLIIRRGDWAKFFLDTWFDPLYRSYNFQKAEIHALEHVVQWHPTVLSKLALVPQRIMNAYAMGNETSAYRSGDFVIRFSDCESGGKCESDAAPFSKQWQTIFNVQR